MRNFKWITNEIRCICKDESGYVKLIQLMFVVLVFTSFFILLVYNLINEETTSKLDIFLTVIVGLIGTIIGTFFSEKSMESLKKDRDIKKREIIRAKRTLKEKLRESEEKINKILKKLN
jgi:uncharacterized protein YneF (UPF0154 family)